MIDIHRELEILSGYGEAGESVYITRLHDLFRQLKDEDGVVRLVFRLALPIDETPVDFEMCLPRVDTLNPDARNLVREYLGAVLYNLISTFGGRELTVYRTDPAHGADRLLDEIEEQFGPDLSKGRRTGYGRCLNVAERMADALDGQAPGTARFVFRRKDISDWIPTAVSGTTPTATERPLLEVLREIPDKLSGKTILGMDVGGSDIKIVLVADGRIIAYKEYDWFPARFTESRQLVEPVLLMAGWARARAAAEDFGDIELIRNLDALAEAETPDDVVRSAVEAAESRLGGDLSGLDAIGLCFPDVVVRDKIVGGEVYKTRGIRGNPDIDYERDFRHLTDLDTQLDAFCKEAGHVHNINDGPMAAFTAAVEMAYSGDESVNDGVFAHTLGTELGTGWLDSSGKLPEIPLEVYNYVIDLGCRAERQYNSDDPRSLNNFNTGIPGTLQKYISQSGVFRLAMKYFPDRQPRLYQELFDLGFVEKDADGTVQILQKPRDMRKPLLEHLMSLANREKDGVSRELFREIGEYIAVTWEETQRILSPKAAKRILFGRLVKDPLCFELMREGASRVTPQVQLEVADDESAWTPLMKQLRDDGRYTVAQFAQAVGAVHFTEIVRS